MNKECSISVTEHAYIWMHHINADKKHNDKVRQELHKNATNYIKEILEETPHETATVRPLTSHL